MKLKPPFLGKKNEPASDVLERAINQHTADRVTLSELLHSLHERGFGLLMLFLALPNCVPLPSPPGVSTLLSIPLLFLSVQMVLGYDSPRLPTKIANRSISRSFLAKMVSYASPKLKKIELLLKPRFSFASTPRGEKILGFFWLLFAISIAVPLPMSNFVPGVGIAISALGLLSRDGVIIILGIAIGIAGLALTTTVLFLGLEAVKAVIDFGFGAAG